MKLSDLRADYREVSGTASTICRQLAFAGIAIVWLFRLEAGGQPRVPARLILPTFLLVASLGLDFLQYIYQSLAFGSYARFRERQSKSKDPDFDLPLWINYPALVCFWGKLGLNAFAYVLLLVFLYGKVA